MRKYNAGIAAIVAAVVLAGCAGHATGQASLALPSQADLQAFKDSLKLAAIADPTLGEARAASISLETAPQPGGYLVKVVARGAEHLKSFYCCLSYDAGSLRATSTKPGPAFGPDSGVLSLAISNPGRLHFGAVIVHPQDKPGFSGDGVLAEVRFAAGGKGLPVASRSTSGVPGTDASRSHILWNAASSTLYWYYANQGDYDQNGMVNLSDLTPLGIHFGEQGPFFLESSLSVIDGDSNGEINLADITPISLGFENDTLSGYAVYASFLPGDYPSSNTAGSKIAPLDTVPWSAATNNPATLRLFFQYVVAAPQATMYYWVRPVSSLGDEGTPSAMAGGNPADVPALSLDNPPASGSGTPGDPYILDGDVAYTFHLLSFSLGDLTNDTGTAYYLSDPQAGTISNTNATLAPTYPFVGELEIWAEYAHIRSSNSIYALVPYYYSWNSTLVDDGGAPNNDVGRYCDTANLNQEPGICYYDATDKNLKYARWVPPLWPLPGFWLTMAVDETGDVGQYCSIVNSSSLPVIAYYDQTQHLLKCAVGTVATPNSAADWTTHTVQDTIEVSGTSIALVGGLPTIAYSDLGHNHLHYARSTNVAPSSTADWVVFELDAWGTATDPSLHSVNAHPGLAYITFPGHLLQYARATTNTPTSAADWITMPVDPASNVGGLSLNDIEGLQPVIVYNDFNTQTLKYATGLTNAAPGTPWNTVIADGEGQPGSYLSFAPVSGRFCLAYPKLGDGLLHFARTNWPYPTENNWQRTVVDAVNPAGGFVSIGAFGLSIADWPGIAYWDNNLDLRFAFGSH